MVSEQVVDGLLVGGEIGGNVHVVQYVSRVDGHSSDRRGQFQLVTIRSVRSAVDNSWEQVDLPILRRPARWSAYQLMRVGLLF